MSVESGQHVSECSDKYLVVRSPEPARDDASSAGDAALEPPAPSPSKLVSRFVMRQVNRARKLMLCGEGFGLKGARTWIRTCRRDWRRHEVESGRIRWAHAHGFSVRQVERFGVNEQNVTSLLSQREYDFLRPINGKYEKWFSDRVTTKAVAGERFADLFEAIHFNLISRFGELLFIPLSGEAVSCVEVCGNGIEALLGFLRGNPGKAFRLAGSSWSSRMRLTVAYDCADGCTLSGAPVSSEELAEVVSERASLAPLVLIEPAEHVCLLPGVGEGFFSNIRVLMFNPLGSCSSVADAYVRVVPAAVDEGERDLDGDDADGIDGEGASSADDLPRVRYYALPVDVATGRYRGGRSVCTQGTYADVATLPSSDVELSGEIPGWGALKERLCALCDSVPQIELLEFVVRPLPSGFRVVGVRPNPPYSRAYMFPDDVQQFLKRRAADKRASKGPSLSLVRHAAFLRLRRRFTQLLYPTGMVYYQGLRYPHDVLADLFSSNGVPLAKKLWAYRHGFLSYRLSLYEGLDEATWQRYVTDFEYRWLRHINPKYRTWMEDKLTFKYLLAGFNDCLPAYYYLTSCRAGENRVLALMDCPDGFDASVQGVIDLAREKGGLALKPDEGSHGEGFYKLEYDPDEGFSLNGERVQEQHVVSVLSNPKNQYLVSEYVELHPALKRIYSGSVNTVRVTVFKRDGVHPQVGNAYLRVGSARSGSVDNVVAGGFVAEVDVATGRFGDARTLLGNRLVRAAVHPDTGQPIEGVLPHWDAVVERVLAMASAVPQLEYMGFDIAIVQDGIKLLEINRYPDYPRISKLTPETISYLLERLEAKKRAMGVEERKSLMRLPRRVR